jgi:hypothetical protein
MAWQPFGLLIAGLQPTALPSATGFEPVVDGSPVSFPVFQPASAGLLDGGGLKPVSPRVEKPA